MKDFMLREGIIPKSIMLKLLREAINVFSKNS